MGGTRFLNGEDEYANQLVGEGVVGQHKANENEAMNGQLGNWAELPVRGQLDKPPMLLTPFVPRVSEELRKIATKYGVTCWHTFPGRPIDCFTAHRGRQHASKRKNCVYCTVCSCGKKYIGETNRNLKVRMKEHLQQSSNTAFSAHLKPAARPQQTQHRTRQFTHHLNSQQEQSQHSDRLSQPTNSTSDNTQHRPIWKDTLVIGSERNGLKRKLMESICIKSKAPLLCNTGLSIDVPAVWGNCREKIARDLSALD